MYHQWWDKDSLIGVYFIPKEGIRFIEGGLERTAVGPSEESQATALMVEARRLKNAEQLEEAVVVLKRIRQDFPFTAQARRALKEIFVVDSMIKKQRFHR